MSFLQLLPVSVTHNGHQFFQIIACTSTALWAVLSLLYRPLTFYGPFSFVTLKLIYTDPHFCSSIYNSLLWMNTFSTSDSNSFLCHETVVALTPESRTWGESWVWGAVSSRLQQVGSVSDRASGAGRSSPDRGFTRRSGPRGFRRLHKHTQVYQSS